MQQEQQQPPEHYDTPQKQHFSRLAAPANTVKARTTEELLAMLSSVPAGQPFEIDTSLLYSPQPSVAGGDVDRGSPTACSYSQDSLAWDELLLQQRCASGVAGSSNAQFSLPAHRPCTNGQLPLFVSIDQAAAALSPLPSAGYLATGAAASSQQPQEAGNAAPLGSQQHASEPPLMSQLEEPQHSGHDRCTSGRHSPAAHLSSCRSSSGSLSGLENHTGVDPHVGTAVAARQRREDRVAQLACPRTNLWQKCARIRAQEEDAELQVGGSPPQQYAMAVLLVARHTTLLSQS